MPQDLWTGAGCRPRFDVERPQLDGAVAVERARPEPGHFAAGYLARIVVTDDGRILTGLPVEDNDERLSLRRKEASSRRSRARRRRRSSRHRSCRDIEELEKQLKPEEIIDLFVFSALDKPPQRSRARAGCPGSAAGGKMIVCMYPGRNPQVKISRALVLGEILIGRAVRASAWHWPRCRRRIPASSASHWSLRPQTDRDIAQDGRSARGAVLAAHVGNRGQVVFEAFEEVAHVVAQPGQVAFEQGLGFVHRSFP